MDYEQVGIFDGFREKGGNGQAVPVAGFKQAGGLAHGLAVFLAPEKHLQAIFRF